MKKTLRRLRRESHKTRAIRLEQQNQKLEEILASLKAERREIDRTVWRLLEEKADAELTVDRLRRKEWARAGREFDQAHVLPSGPVRIASEDPWIVRSFLAMKAAEKQ